MSKFRDPPSDHPALALIEVPTVQILAYDERHGVTVVVVDEPGFHAGATACQQPVATVQYLPAARDLNRVQRRASAIFRYRKIFRVSRKLG